jgi:hypothetical protein
MSKIRPAGGMGNEAIEIGLLHANKQLLDGGLTQVILIGDVPPNTRDEVSQRFNSTDRTRFTTPSYWETELQKLHDGNVLVPIHAFYVDSRAEKAFKEIAKCSGGTSDFLDVNSTNGSDLLKRFLTEQILRGSAAGNGALAKILVTAYRDKYTSTIKRD